MTASLSNKVKQIVLKKSIYITAFHYALKKETKKKQHLCFTFAYLTLRFCPLGQVLQDFEVFLLICSDGREKIDK